MFGKLRKISRGTREGAEVDEQGLDQTHVQMSGDDMCKEQ